MCRKTCVTIAIIVAFGLGICAIFLPDNVQPYLALIMKIFEVAIPVLAVAALLKYIACGHHHHHNCPCCNKGDCNKGSCN